MGKILKKAAKQKRKVRKVSRKRMTPEMKKLNRSGKLRRVRFGSYSAGMTAIVAAGAIVLNLVAAEIPSQYTQFDVSGLQLSVLSEQTKEFAKGLTKDITLYYIVQDVNRDTYVSRLLERYDDLSDHITVEEKDPVLYPKFTSQYTDETLPENSIIAVCGDKSRVISYNDMYESEFNYSYYTYETTGFDAEGQITSALAALEAEEIPKVYMLTGHGETELSDTMMTSVEKENIETEELNLVTAEGVPEDADCLMVLSPRNDFSDAETQKILNYLRRGGKAILISDYTGEEMPNYDSVLAYYGLERVDGVVMEGSSNYYVQVPYYIVPDISSTEVSENLAGNAYVLLAAAQGLQKTEEQRDGVSRSAVLTSSDKAYSKQNVETMTTYAQEENDISGPFDLGVIVTEEVELTDELLAETAETVQEDVIGNAELELGIGQEIAEGTENAAEVNEQDSEDTSGTEETADETEEAAAESPAVAETAQTKVAVFTSSAILDESADQMVSGGNSSLFMNTVSWICGQDTSAAVPVKSLSMDYLTVTASSGNFWSIIVIGIIPAVFLFGGLVIWLRRRKQ